MMANILRSIPMLLVIGFNLLLAILFSLIYARSIRKLIYSSS
ncbi:Uncharacterised protein [Klebsiella quasipneumoniae]|jgi:hypothetical protein|uniref:Uncharacterized protein n=1 Tax=Klebsiella quasipneumoniae TaxID=1463165 RepID=A0ABD7N8E6_9ENTR|nr:Uncharacterised protein [Klebsiella quasipneumoniae]SSG88322.1 Uncharacterised protein [Klebsiella quasipneumoniae]